MAFEAARLSLEHMTPVVLLSDGYIANGSTPWKLPDLEKDFPAIKTKIVKESEIEGDYLPYKRDPKTLVRSWAIPGTPNLMHRVGGLEKEEETGNVSYDPTNHQTMVNSRSTKVRRVADHIPAQEVDGDKDSSVLVISWGGTYGSVHEAVKVLAERDLGVAHAHIQYLNPMPRNMEDIINKYEKIIVCELNQSQLKGILQSKFGKKLDGLNKIQGKPFKLRELTQMIEKELES